MQKKKRKWKAGSASPEIKITCTEHPNPEKLDAAIDNFLSDIVKQELNKQRDFAAGEGDE